MSIAKLLLLPITISFVVSLGYYVWNYSFSRHPSKRIAIDLGIMVTVAFSFYFYLFIVRPPESSLSNYHLANLIGLFLVFLFLQSIRAILDQLDVKARENRFCFDKAFLFKNLGDMLIEFTMFLAIYTMIIYSSVGKSDFRFYTITGYLLSAFCIFKVLKYRIYDDLYRRWLHQGGSFIGPTTSAPTTLLQGVYNVLFRAYLVIALSFASIYILLYYDNMSTSGKEIFSANNKSGNLFVDFIYFSIITMSTVGYGDISPIGVIPKLLCAFQVLLGYFFIGSTFSYIFYIISIQSNPRL